MTTANFNTHTGEHLSDLGIEKDFLSHHLKKKL